MTHLVFVQLGPAPEPEGRPGGCFTCQHWSGKLGGWSRREAWCLKFEQYETFPHKGCVFWRRQPGTDDEPYWERIES